MNKLPEQFADILNDAGREWLTRKRPIDLFRDTDQSIELCVIRPDACALILKLLEEHIRPHLSTIIRDMPTSPRAMKKYKEDNTAPIPWHSQSSFVNYDLPENLKDAPSYGDVGPDATHLFLKAVEETGIRRLFQSSSYAEWWCNITGSSLDQFDAFGNTLQLSRYYPGDSIGLHNDYYGTKKKPQWLVNTHFSFAVNAIQTMLYGAERLDRVVDLSRSGHVGIYKLPAWHQVTPLIAQDPEQEAYRWLCIVDCWYK